MPRRNDTHLIRTDIAKSGSELGEALGNVLTELQRTKDELLHQFLDETRQLRRTVEYIQADAAAARQEIQQLRAEAAEERAAAAAPQTAITPAGDGDTSSLDGLLSRAAGIAYAEMVCHRDTWAFLIEQASRRDHFRLPADIDENGDGTIDVDISGRTLIAAIEAMWEAMQSGHTPVGSRHLATQIYSRIEDALSRVQRSEGTPERPTTDGEQPERPVTRIIIDDRPLRTDEPPTDGRDEEGDGGDEPELTT